MSWLILGAIFIIILFVLVGLMKTNVLYLSGGASGLAFVIFGFGGAIFLIIGIIKSIVERLRK